MARAGLSLARPDLQAPLRRPASRAGPARLSRFVRRKPLGTIGAVLVMRWKNAEVLEPGEYLRSGKK